jgi:hypothetical protein
MAKIIPMQKMETEQETIKRILRDVLRQTTPGGKVPDAELIAFCRHKLSFLLDYIDPPRVRDNRPSTPSA